MCIKNRFNMVVAMYLTCHDFDYVSLNVTLQLPYNTIFLEKLMRSATAVVLEVCTKSI